MKNLCHLGLAPDGPEQQLEEGLRRIDEAELRGKFKTWIYKHGLHPVWPLIVNEVPLSLIEQLEQAVSKDIRRGLALPLSFSSVGMYGKSTKLQLPLTSLVEEYKVAKTRLFLTLRDSLDEKISKAGIEVHEGSGQSPRRYKKQRAACITR